MGLTLAALAWPQSPLAATVPPADTVPAEAQRLAAGDRIAISVYQTPELATDTRLDPSSAITMPQAGRVPLAGDTAQQAEQAIANRLRQTYLLDPQVSVEVRAFAPQPVTVLGAVARPGVYSARSFPSLDAVLAAAGGVVAPAGDRVELIRPDQPARTFNTARPLTAPVEVRGGDLVRVVPPGEVYVGGEVNTPGSFVLPASGLTLAEALSLAGGVKRDGGTGRLRIVHRPPDAAASVEWVNAGPILSGHAADRTLAPNDLVYVPHSTGRTAFFNGLTTAVATGAAILTGIIVFPRPASVIRSVDVPVEPTSRPIHAPIAPPPPPSGPVTGGGGLL